MGNPLKSYGRAAVSDFLGDRIVYRNLQPYDRSLPGFDQLRLELNMPGESLPRKNEAGYARVIVELLKECRKQDFPGGQLERLVFVGDTRLLDGTAYANLCRVSGWPGQAFIGAEDDLPASLIQEKAEGGFPVLLSNRWAALEAFDEHCRLRGVPIEAGTAVVIDLDKTTIGARGRNGQVIDEARMQAVEETVSGLLGSGFNKQKFAAVYQPLNQPEFHPFTADNQDNLAYVCLILGCGLFEFGELVRRVRMGEMKSFVEFIDEVENRKAELSLELRQIHQEIIERVRSGDPTPFKAFRRNEYILTVKRFGCLEDSAPAAEMLNQEIVITQEVRRMAEIWRERGALLFGLSDKPDEASLPTATLEECGFQPLHRAITHAVGE